MIELINKQKIRADDRISVILVIGYIIFALFLRLEAFLSLIVYPFVALIIYGTLKIVNALNKRNKGKTDNTVKFIFGLVSIIFSIFFLMFILSYPNVTLQIILNLIAFPLIIVGLAAIIKGKMINIYLKKYRILNIVIGLITIIVCLLTFFSPSIFPKNPFIFHFTSLCVVLFLNIYGRAALYLSEFGLSIKHVRNFKLFLYIISDYLVHIDINGKILLHKIE
ncbi:MAG: DUF308 domain-containing protein [Promethearchaeota archaeon]